MTLKYSSTRPDDELDGMQDLEEHFLAGDPDDVVVVALITRNGLAKKDPAPFSASIKVKHIEPVTGETRDSVLRLLKEQYGRRTGNQTLPIDGDADEQFDFPEDGE